MAGVEWGVNDLGVQGDLPLARELVGCLLKPKTSRGRGVG